MSSKSESAQRYTLTELGISTTADDRCHIDIESIPNLGLQNLRIVFDSHTQTWKVDPSSTKSITNGDAPSLNHQSHHASNRSQIWVDRLPDTDHIKFFRGTNWSETPLGPLEVWPVSLQTLVGSLMAESMAAAIYWGPELCAIYNAEMMKLNRDRLSREALDSMGKSFRDIWPDIWHSFAPMLNDVIERGIPLDTLDVNLFPVRHGMVEETFWTGSFIPLRDTDGKVQGFFNRGRETTNEIVNARRTKTLNAIALPPSLEGNFVWKHLFNAFRDNDREFPMAFVYKATDEADTGVKLQLQESIGLPKDGHPLVPEELDLFAGQTGFAPYFRRAKAADRPLLLHKSNETLPEALIKGFDWQGFQEPSMSIAIVAINASDRLLGIMVMGLNPRRPYDADYEGFLNSLARHTSSTVINAVGKEEVQLRAERLEKQLNDTEKQIREIAVHGPVGMAQVALNGKIQWANDQFYELTGHSKKEEDQYELSFVDVVDPMDQELCSSRWYVLTEQRKRTTTALRLKRRWKPPSSPGDQENKEEPVWVTASAYPIIEEGELKYIATAVTDISHFKWAEAHESRNAAAAKEAKRLQENFIDIVSHEMRNPLSAITQLADGISCSFEDLNNSKDFERAKAVLEDNVESAKTILLCAAHQKRIIDDVLTLSKLDSMMLSITPVVVQPRKIVESALKMFEGEFQTNDINFHSVIDSSYDKYEVDWVTIDPSRLTQIFINLITNAIKFTKLEKRREIKVRTSATPDRPPTVAGVTWFPTHKEYRDLTKGKEWGQGSDIFLCFEVQDTGRGLEQEEMSKLFGRFQQATAKTHIKYGGSGLGLFISRELTETQGGEIGVVSEPGKGSTFAFYVKGRRANPPDDPARVMSAPADNDQTARRLSNHESKHATDRIDKSKHVLLLVEDNVVNAKVLTRQLEKAKCEVHIANHGMEALDFLSKTRSWENSAEESHAVDIDCVLMDVEMPIMDGLTCTRRIRQLEEEGKLSKHINIVAITANARQEQIDTVLKAGADDVMPKPFRVEELLRKVRDVRARMENG